ncbi:MAG: hypothetical protein E6Z15_04260, partial [Paenibacillus macerans]|nr:hypothetical protein [Paenibacillus macerans]
ILICANSVVFDKNCNLTHKGEIAVKFIVQPGVFQVLNDVRYFNCKVQTGWVDSENRMFNVSS